MEEDAEEVTAVYRQSRKRTRREVSEVVLEEQDVVFTERRVTWPALKIPPPALQLQPLAEHDQGKEEGAHPA